MTPEIIFEWALVITTMFCGIVIMIRETFDER